MALIPLQVYAANGQSIAIEALIDTGFEGELTLPSDAIQQLGLSRRTPRLMELADGTDVLMETYQASILWDDSVREVLVFEAEGDALLGMALYKNYKLTIEVKDGGYVTLEPLP